MAWIIIEGIDKSGKSTLAKHYESKGYVVHHIGAPDKKYSQAGYAGPSFVDDLLEIVMQCNGKDAVFDRSWYGEAAIWPYVYNRTPRISEEELEIFKEFEYKNNAELIYMMDADVNAHWKRCVDYKEDINHSQFKVALSLHQKMAHKYGFLPRELKDYPDVQTMDGKQTSTTSKQTETKPLGQNKDVVSSDGSANTLSSKQDKVKIAKQQENEAIERAIEKANAIRDILNTKIIKSKSRLADELEQEVREFLQEKLKNIFTPSSNSTIFSENEVQILKMFCKKLEDKEPLVKRK